jgi:succinylarginine dihydrolase
LIRRSRWLTRPTLKLPRLRRRRVHSFADESACVFDILMLAAEAQRVINLRLAATAGGGPAAELETRLMVTEKMKAALDAASMLARGASTQSVISFYRSRVRSNVRRLTRKPLLHHAASAFRGMTSRNGIDKV